MPFLSESLAGQPPRPVVPESQHNSILENDDEEQPVREINFASGPGAVAGRNAVVLHLDDNMTPEDVQRIQDVLRRQREQEPKSSSGGRRGGIVINQAIGPGAIAGSNAMVITSFRR